MGNRRTGRIKEDHKEDHREDHREEQTGNIGISNREEQGGSRAGRSRSRQEEGSIAQGGAGSIITQNQSRSVPGSSKISPLGSGSGRIWKEISP